MRMGSTSAGNVVWPGSVKYLFHGLILRLRGRSR
jgi:hypothetical protein